MYFALNPIIICFLYQFPAGKACMIEGRIELVQKCAPKRVHLPDLQWMPLSSYSVRILGIPESPWQGRLDTHALCCSVYLKLKGKDLAQRPWRLIQVLIDRQFGPFTKCLKLYRTVTSHLTFILRFLGHVEIGT